MKIIAGATREGKTSVQKKLFTGADNLEVVIPVIPSTEDVSFYGKIHIVAKLRSAQTHTVLKPLHSQFFVN